MSRGVVRAEFDRQCCVSWLNWGSSQNFGAALYNVCPAAPSAKNNGTLQSYTAMNCGPGSSQFVTFNQTFGYDNANRLIASNDSGGWSRNFGYDPYGNMWVTGNTPTSQSQFTSNNQIAGNSYDAAGNLLSVNGNTANYDAENQLVQVAEAPAAGGGIENLAYDGLGRRVEKLVPSAMSVYVYDAFGLLAASYSSAAAAAQCKTCYLSTDHLGSVRLVTDQNGSVVARHDYLPFGEEIPANMAGRNGPWGSTVDVVYKFTGKERDQETGLDYFGARYYGSALGRFTSPDPLGGHYTDPQTLNRYAYVRNNPLRFVDPDGLDLRASCDQESDTCHKAHWWSGRYEGTWDQDHKHFTVTQFQTDSSGNLAGHTINFDASGIHIDGHQGSFIAGTDPTRVNGTGAFSGTHFVANSNCLGTCIAGGGLFANDGGAFLGVGAFGFKGPNLGVDRFGEHPGDQYRGGNTNGPDAHLSFVPGGTELPLHFDTRFPYGSISGFAVHTGDLFYHDFQTRVLRRQDTQLPDDIKPAQSVPQP